MKFLSVCSGIEAASLAWGPLGWHAVGFAEIEKFPSALLASRFPDVPNLGDMTRHAEWEIESPDVLVGGTPCQSFSVAGLRAGMDDPRGNLALVYLAIAERLRPRWVVWENVPGVLSSNEGRDFGSFVGGLAELGYGWAYRVLDAQFFGVPQRRERVFVVGYLGDWRRAAAVLFERHGLEATGAPTRTPKDVWAFDNGLSANFNMPVGQDFIPCIIKTRCHCVAYADFVRRLTPIEEERAQGFPDDYTLVPYCGKPASDGPRYKAIGNSMAVPVMRWIGERIALVELEPTCP